MFNRYMLFYLAWRVMRGLHTEITLHFMPPGHTKFAPDWCFGLLKRKFRASTVYDLDGMKLAVTSSTKDSKVNVPKLVGTEDATVYVPTYRWVEY